MPGPLTVLTVATAPELPFARVLAASVREHHPDAQVVVVSADGAAPTGLPEGVEGLGPDDLGLDVPPAQVAVLAPEAASLAVLVPALDRLLADGGDVVVLAPDSLVLGPIDRLLLGDAPVTLMGRAPTPPPDDGLHPDAKDLEHLPVIDPGAFVMRPSSRDIVSLWRARAGASAWALPEDGSLCARLLALRDEPGVATTMNPVGVLAWWTVTPGALGREHGRVTLGGEPVSLVRLPGFDVSLPTRLHPQLNRVRVSSDTHLRALLDDVTARLLAAGADGGRVQSVLLPDGRPLPPALAAMMAEALVAGALAEPPADDRGWNVFWDYCNAPAGWGADLGMTRYLAALWESRSDLREVYPDVRGGDGPGYVGWAWVHGRDLVPDELLPPRPPHVPEHVRSGVAGVGARELDPVHTDPVWGVNVAGFFRSELGLGEAARLLIAGLDAARVPALPVQGSFVPPCRQGAEFTFATPDEAPYPLNILCLNGDAIPAFAEEAGEAFFAGKKTIALWWWEVGDLPPTWQESFRWVDEVWVATDHIRDLIAPSCPVPVQKITLPVGDPPAANVTRSDLGLPDEPFIFLYVYDYHSTEARKNPTGLIRAFKQAFPPGSGAHLVLKCINADTMFAHHDRVLLEIGDHPDISFVDTYLSVGEKNALIALSDCYVSPHRSEGFGLTPAEAMLLGTPVIATNYGGVLEFLTDDNAYLVDYELVPVGEHADPYPPDAVWADPDVDQLAARMRHVFEHPQEAAARAARAATEIRLGHTPRAAGGTMEPLLQAHYQGLIEEGARGLRIAHVPSVDLGTPGVELTSVLRGAGQRSGASEKARWLTQRIKRPFTARRDLVSKQLLDRVGELDAKVQELSAELERHRLAGHAEVLAQFRRVRSDLTQLQATTDLRTHAQSLRTDELARTIEHHLAEHQALPYMAEAHAPALLDDPVAGRVLGYRGGTGDVEAYRAFTDTFRGGEERVRALQVPYLDLLRDAGPVLDTGCGRGEMLDLLREHEIEARGVDGDEGMVEYARRKGHDVTLADVNDYLESLPEASLGAITSLEVVEHMPADALERFLGLARTRLRPGGVLIAETVNPHALFALKAFWLDPTHHHPLFPEVLLTLARIAGFPEAFVYHPTGTGDVEADRTRQPQYALVAKA